MKTPREKYQNDAHYKRLVDLMVSQIMQCNFTPSEMREAAVLASIIYHENYVRPLVKIEITRDLENAFRVFREFEDKNNI